jgi:predicted ATPase
MACDRVGLFAAGKFYQYKRDIPYTTPAQAFQTLVRQILVKSEADVDGRNTKIPALKINKYRFKTANP